MSRWRRFIPSPAWWLWYEISGLYSRFRQWLRTPEERKAYSQAAFNTFMEGTAPPPINEASYKQIGELLRGAENKRYRSPRNGRQRGAQRSGLSKGARA